MIKEWKLIIIIVRILCSYEDKDWPEDDWFSISNEWDLNLYKDEKGIYARVYPVNKNGDTITKDGGELVYEKEIN